MILAVVFLFFFVATVKKLHKGTVNDIVEATMFLIDENKAGWINGHSLVLDGGWTKQIANYGFDILTKKINQSKNQKNKHKNNQSKL